MTRIDKSQIQVGKNGSVYLNTEDGLSMILKADLPSEKYPFKTLNEDDVKKSKGYTSPEGYSVTSIFSRQSKLWIMSESDTENKIHLERVAFLLNDNELKEKEFKIDRPYRIIKAFIHDSKIYTLDLRGNARVIDLDLREVTATEEHCTDIFVTASSYFTQRVVKDIKSRDIRYQVLRYDHGEEQEELPSLEEENFKMTNAIAEQAYVPSFFQFCYCTLGLMLLISGGSIYIRSKVTAKWKK